MAVLSQVSTKAAVVFYVLQMSLLIATLLQPQCCSNSERAGSSDNQGHCLLLHFCKTQTKDMPLEVINGSCDTCSHTVTTFGSIGLTKHHPRRHLHTRTPSRALPPTPTPSKTDPFNPPSNLLPPLFFSSSHTLWAKLHAHCPETWWTIQPYGNFSSQFASVSYICVCVVPTAAAAAAVWQWQWLGSGIRLALSDILLQLDWEAAPFPLSSDKQGNFSPAFILRLWLRFLFNLLMPEEGSLATLRILVSSGQTRPLWTAENNVMPYAAPLEQGWPKSSGTHPPPPTLRQLSPEPLRSHFSPRPLRHARVKSAGFLIHHNPLSNCVVSLFLSTILEEKGFPSKTKGLKMNFALTRRHGLPLNRRLWDLMKVNCEYSSFSPPLHQWFVSQSPENHALSD